MLELRAAQRCWLAPFCHGARRWWLHPACLLKSAGPSFCGVEELCVLEGAGRAGMCRGDP